ncbi:hypothetical protein ACHAXS_009876 [Conticribra weissflogii]
MSKTTGPSFPTLPSKWDKDRPCYDRPNLPIRILSLLLILSASISFPSSPSFASSFGYALCPSRPASHTFRSMNARSKFLPNNGGISKKYYGVTTTSSSPGKNTRNSSGAVLLRFKHDSEEAAEALLSQNKEDMTLPLSSSREPTTGTPQERQKLQQQQRHSENEEKERGVEESENDDDPKPRIQERRRLGSMEMFMLPRPVGPDLDPMRFSDDILVSHSENPTLPPRQTKERPPMNHIAAFVLSSTPSVTALRRALDNAVRTHPLLRARIAGDGMPRMWLDPVRRMVRWNGWGDDNDKADKIDFNEDIGKKWNGVEEHPLEFVIHAIDDDYSNVTNENDDGRDRNPRKNNVPNYWGGSLRVKNIQGSTRQDLDASWHERFGHDLDSGTVMSVVGAKEGRGDLWRLELHRLAVGSSTEDGSIDDDSPMPNVPCALVLTMNHAISDQGSVNLVMDQILSDVVDIERGMEESAVDRNMAVEHPAVVQPVPKSLEESVLGGQLSPSSSSSSEVDTSKRMTLSSLLKSPFSSSFKDLREYAFGKVQEAMTVESPPALLPESPTQGDATGGGILTPTSIILSGSPWGIEDISHRRSCVQYRTLPPEITAALIKKSKGRRVPISMTLAAAVAAACTDFFNENEMDGGKKSRTYKLLQSLDTRRFSGATDPGDTLSCQAGSMDLLVGPLPDFLGRKIRSVGKIDGSVTSVEEKEEAMDAFWRVAKQSYEQTASYLKKGDAIEALRLFDLGMNICDIGRLVDSYATSSASKGRAWSAGITNVGEYERQRVVPREGVSERGNLQAKRGDYEIQEIYYATSHARVGCTFPVGCITVKGKMSCTINPPWPLISEERSEAFADAFVEILEVIAKDDV